MSRSTIRHELLAERCAAACAALTGMVDAAFLGSGDIAASLTTFAAALNTAANNFTTVADAADAVAKAAGALKIASASLTNTATVIIAFIAANKAVNAFRIITKEDADVTTGFINAVNSAEAEATFSDAGAALRTAYNKATIDTGTAAAAIAAIPQAAIQSERQK